VILINGEGQQALASIATLSKKTATLLLSSVKNNEKRGENSLYLAFMRPQNIDLILEKGTELGISSFLFFEGEKSDKGVKNAMGRILKRGESICISALKQSQRLYLPTITLLPPIKEWKKLPPHTFFGSLLPHATPFSKQEKNIPLQWVIGPESGFSKEEEHALIALGAAPTTLSTHVLRAETAALTAAVLMEVDRE